MAERAADTTICVAVEEYKELIGFKVMYEALKVQYWEMKPKYDKLLGAMTKPTFGKLEDKDETAS